MKVAVVGAGPAGCAAAYSLANNGHDATVFTGHAGRVGGCCKTIQTEMPDGVVVRYEVGPQIAYSRYPEVWKLVDQYLKIKLCPTSIDGKYYQQVCLTPGQNGYHPFPPSLANLELLKRPVLDSCEELYFSLREGCNCELLSNYLAHVMGWEIYSAYYEGYNSKQWGMYWDEILATWAKARKMCLRRIGDEGQVFGNQRQGHPGDYNPLWEGLLANVKVYHQEADLLDVTRLPGGPYEAVVWTPTIKDDLPFVHVHEVFMVADTGKRMLLPTYLVSIPNEQCEATRVMDYRGQYWHDSEYSLISWSFPNTAVEDQTAYYEQKALELYQTMFPHISGRIHSAQVLYNAYPINTKATEDVYLARLKSLVNKTRGPAIIPIGRAGMYCYCSKDVAMWQGLHIGKFLNEYMEWLPEDRIELLMDLRKDMR